MTTDDDRPPPGNAKEIHTFLHCGRCTTAGKRSDLEVGFTPIGVQVWCRGCDSNILHVDFQGTRHPANTTAPRKPGDPRRS